TPNWYLWAIVAGIRRVYTLVIQQEAESGIGVTTMATINSKDLAIKLVEISDTARKSRLWKLSSRALAASKTANCYNIEVGRYYVEDISKAIHNSGLTDIQTMAKVGKILDECTGQQAGAWLIQARIDIDNSNARLQAS
ncbi:MAG: hypothetical protein Q7O66_19895, partial [Dehalococcoidia bacterium]|nr:hypothetical protein [Dehalococcoidia bacterium]